MPPTPEFVERIEVGMQANEMVMPTIARLVALAGIKSYEALPDDMGSFLNGDCYQTEGFSQEKNIIVQLYGMNGWILVNSDRQSLELAKQFEQIPEIPTSIHILDREDWEGIFDYMYNYEATVPPVQRLQHYRDFDIQYRGVTNRETRMVNEAFQRINGGYISAEILIDELLVKFRSIAEQESGPFNFGYVLDTLAEYLDVE